MNYPVDQEFYLVRSTNSIVNTTLNIDPNKGYTHVTVSSCSIPKTFYVLPNNCSLIINEGKTAYTFNFMAGNYTINSFISIFNTSISTSGCSYTYSVSYPNRNTQVDTGFFTFTVSNNSGIQPSFFTSNIYLGNIMGILENVVYNFSGNTLTSSTQINYQSYDELVLKSDIVSNKMSLLQEIYSADDLYQSSILWQNNNLQLNAKILNPLASNNYTFSLLDGDGNTINLNGNPWSMVICVFKISNIEKVIKDYIQLQLIKEKMGNVDLE